MDLSGLNNLVDMFGTLSGQLAKEMNGLKEIEGRLKTQIPEENKKDFEDVFNLSNELRKSFEDGKNPNDLVDRIHNANEALKKKYKDAD